MKKINDNLKKDIKILDLDRECLTILKDNSINLIEDLWLLTKKDLKTLGISDKDIKYISIKLQLLGLDLNKKIY
jgi:hypothetical protein